MPRYKMLQRLDADELSKIKGSERAGYEFIRRERVLGQEGLLQKDNTILAFDYLRFLLWRIECGYHPGLAENEVYAMGYKTINGARRAVVYYGKRLDKRKITGRRRDGNTRIIQLKTHALFHYIESGSCIQFPLQVSYLCESEEVGLQRTYRTSIVHAQYAALMHNISVMNRRLLPFYFSRNGLLNDEQFTDVVARFIQNKYGGMVLEEDIASAIRTTAGDVEQKWMTDGLFIPQRDLISLLFANITLVHKAVH